MARPAGRRRRVAQHQLLGRLTDVHQRRRGRVPHVRDAVVRVGVAVQDVVFGTRCLPADREPSADIGLHDLPGFPTTFTGMLVSPFRWPAATPSASRDAA